MRARTTAGMALLLAALLVASGCGGGGKKTSGSLAENSQGGSSSTEPTAAPATESTAAPGTTAGTTATTAPTAGTPSKVAAAGSTPQPAAPGGVNLPKAGKYVYLSSGSQDRQPPATPTTYKDRETTIEYLEPKPVEGGTEVKYRAGSEQGTSTTTQRWEASRILMLSITFQGPQGQVECRFNTAQGGLEIAHFPMKPEKFARQEWRNDTCEGTHDEEVLRKETVTVKTGTFEAWVVKTTTHIQLQFTSQGGGPLAAGPQTVETTITSTQWVAPQIGVDVKSESTNDFTFGAQSSKGTSARELKTKP